VTTWIILRAAGIAAYLMLFCSVAFGLIATSAPFDKRFAKASSISIHQFMATVGLVLLGIHIGGLLMDTYVHFGPIQILVPGTSAYRPVAVALGVGAMYAMVLVLVSSWFRKGYSPKVWRALHLGAAPAFVLSMLHGVFAGADSSRPWMYLIYVSTACIVVFLLLLRGLTVGIRPARRVQSSPDSPPLEPRLRSSEPSGEAVPTGPAGRSPEAELVGVALDPERLAVRASPSAPAEDVRSDTNAGAETRIGVAGSVRRVPAIAKAPAISAAARAVPAAPKATTVAPRRSMGSR
jgi:sulfoxide reductase heme-binding subunit YedZ